jgi:hypothetical protein
MLWIRRPTETVNKFKSSAKKDLPIIRIRRNSIRASQISQVLCVSRSISRNGDTLSPASRLMITRDTQSSKFLRRFNNGGRETHDNMPFLTIGSANG